MSTLIVGIAKWNIQTEDEPNPNRSCFMVFRVMGIIQTESELKWISDRTPNFQNSKKELVPNMNSILNI